MASQSSEATDSSGSSVAIVGDRTAESLPPTTRRRFIGWATLGTASLIGASGILGRVVGFTPTAQAAVNFNCQPFDHPKSLNCWGQCELFQSCCRCRLSGDQQYCCCLCPTGPGTCQPRIFRAHCKKTYEIAGTGKCCCSPC